MFHFARANLLSNFNVIWGRVHSALSGAVPEAGTLGRSTIAIFLLHTIRQIAQFENRLMTLTPGTRISRFSRLTTEI